MTLDTKYPAIADLRDKARRRLPHFVWEYLDSGTGKEVTTTGNNAAFDAVKMMPSVLHGEIEPDLTTSFLGAEYAAPFGIAPVGMSGLVWPDAEHMLARAAAKAEIPFTISTVSTQRPEDMQRHIGPNAWFQLYPPRDPDIRKDMLSRIKAAGFSTLVLTVDVPVGSRRERQVRSGLTTPPKITPRLLAQIAIRPAWAMAMAQNGIPRMRFIDDYAPDSKGLPSNQHAGYLLRTSPDWDYVKWLRDHWEGPFIIKGILDAPDAEQLQAQGVDALWVSNHAGRQFDAAPATIDVLPQIRAATGLPLILDGGVESGLDILRAMALGADLVMLGRAWHYAIAALGEAGPAHLVHILTADMKANMGQLGLIRPDASHTRLSSKTP